MSHGVQNATKLNNLCKFHFTKPWFFFVLQVNPNKSNVKLLSDLQYFEISYFRVTEDSNCTPHKNITYWYLTTPEIQFYILLYTSEFL